jgi:hypothetical protein
MSLAFVGCGGSDDEDDGGETGPEIYLLGAMDIENNATQKGWATNGMDNVETALTIEIFQAAKYLVLEMPTAPVNGLQIIWQGDGDNYGWNEQQEVLKNDGTPDPEKGASVTEDGGKAILRFELSKACKNYEAVALSTKAKIFIGFYSPNVDGLGITKAYLEMAE